MLILGLIFWLSSLTAPPGNVAALLTTVPQATHSSEEPAKGQIVERLPCIDAPNQSYALYLPSNYSTERKWPVLYAFDPGARGQIPVQRFQEAAERFGWIVVGSNNSRNGAFQPSIDAWNTIVKDTHDRFVIDDARVYLTGFSGGARLAFYLAIRCQDCIAGVIGSGAGFPAGVTPSPALHFAVFSTTGIEDFNFGEVKSLADALEKAGIAHRTKVFSGQHEWPPSSIAFEALEWMELQAMKSGKRPRDPNLIESVWQTKLKQARDQEESQRTYDAYESYLVLNEGFKGLRDVAAVEQKVSLLRDSPEVRTALRSEQQQINKQRQIETRINGLLSTQERNSGSDRESTNEGLNPETRLMGMFADLRKQADLIEDTDERRVARRVLGSVFVGLFEQGANQLQTLKRYDDAIRSFSLATEVNPARAGAFFYLAWAYAAQGEKKRALRTLQIAVDKGFSDLSAIEGNQAFDSIRGDAQYREIIKAVHSKQ